MRDVEEAVGSLGSLARRLRELADDLEIIQSVRDGTIRRPARTLIRERRDRDAAFGADLFADPAWDILLDLFAAHQEGKRVSVSSACIAAAVPSTTAMRWLKLMVERGLVRRIEDKRDGRRIFVELTPSAILAMETLLSGSR